MFTSLSRNCSRNISKLIKQQKELLDASIRTKSTCLNCTNQKNILNSRNPILQQLRFKS
jgi:cytochrome c-type biogenesis protein CcmH/NrfF